MTLRCFLTGCTWKLSDAWHYLGERLITNTCQRCGARKTESER